MEQSNRGRKRPRHCRENTGCMGNRWRQNRSGMIWIRPAQRGPGNRLRQGELESNPVWGRRQTAESLAYREWSSQVDATTTFPGL
jgi:hypothetical protein